MLGAIIGDVAGSSYEVKEINDKRKKGKTSYEDRIKIMDKNIPLFTYMSSITDDSILTIAIADALLNNEDYGEKLREYGKRELDLGTDIYGRSRFGRGFVSWILDGKFCESYGNGCAMRISAIPELLEDEEKILEETYKATIPTHNHEESLLCVKALVKTIIMAKEKRSKEEIKKEIEENYFKLDFDLENLRHNYTFTARAIDSVPQAIFAFLESNDFEDSIRKAISIGGDTDTIAAITGSISENYYGIPEEIKENVIKYIPDYMMEIVNNFYDRKKDLNVKRLSRKINRK